MTPLFNNPLITQGVGSELSVDSRLTKEIDEKVEGQSVSLLEERRRDVERELNSILQEKALLEKMVAQNRAEIVELLKNQQIVKDQIARDREFQETYLSQVRNMKEASYSNENYEQNLRRKIAKLRDELDELRREDEDVNLDLHSALQSYERKLKTVQEQIEESEEEKEELRNKLHVKEEIQRQTQVESK